MLSLDVMIRVVWSETESSHCAGAATWLLVDVLRKSGGCVMSLPVFWEGLGPAVGLPKKEPWRTGAAMASPG